MNRESWLAYLPSRVIYRRKYVCQSTHEWYEHRRLDGAGVNRPVICRLEDSPWVSAQ